MNTPTDSLLPFLEGALCRVAGAPALREAVVLRGGLLVRQWSGPVHRPVDDLDFLWTEPFAPELIASGLRTALASEVGDGVVFDAASASEELIWAETANPGVRLRVPARAMGVTAELQIDVGCNDPLDPPASWCEVPTASGPVQVRAVRPETMLAWKVHGLFERGRGRWRAKDLWDVDVLSRHAPREDAAFQRALRLAFESRGMTLSELDRLLEGQFGTSRGSRRRWERFRKERGAPELPEQLPELIARVAAFLRPHVLANRSNPMLTRGSPAGV
ncbi:nucleotidyl transferase AbiEii/AbiGii toxin family protein [Vitiosangium sp. GDMCC 1.1324]|uniref:nucleotidyl transferase AbiEii/AbiGii toxin family protein n=1 Tax=Vitiosangium sp. (strain GDMCC 1.1324) TaxID=2138576 RepID=UPI00130D6B4F|nr:nucleotidyl transferase AbiEii/AbiGii toxin family protein [Vitiosangium sp. GDMCC 1.1324]